MVDKSLRIIGNIFAFIIMFTVGTIYKKQSEARYKFSILAQTGKFGDLVVLEGQFTADKPAPDVLPVDIRNGTVVKTKEPRLFQSVDIDGCDKVREVSTIYHHTDWWSSPSYTTRNICNNIYNSVSVSPNVKFADIPVNTSTLKSASRNMAKVKKVGSLNAHQIFENLGVKNYTTNSGEYEVYVTHINNGEKLMMFGRVSGSEIVPICVSNDKNRLMNCVKKHLGIISYWTFFFGFLLIAFIIFMIAMQAKYGTDPRYRSKNLNRRRYIVV